MAVNTDVLIPDYGTAPHPVLLQNDIDCTISLLGTANTSVWTNITLDNNVEVYRKQATGSLMEDYSVDASLVNGTVYAYQYWADLSSNPFPLSLPGRAALKFTMVGDILSANTGSRGFRIAFTSKTSLPVYVYLGGTSTTALLRSMTGITRRVAGFVPRGTDPTTLTGANITLGSLCLNGVNGGRAIHYINGAQVDSNASNNDLDTSFYVRPNQEYARDWSTAAYEVDFNGGATRYFDGFINLVDHDYVEYCSHNGGGAYSGNGYYSEIYLMAYTTAADPVAPSFRWQNYVRSAEIER